MCLLRIEFLDLYHMLNVRLALPTFESAFSASSYAQEFALLNQMLTDHGALELNSMFCAGMLTRIHVGGGSQHENVEAALALGTTGLATPALPPTSSF